MAKKKRMFKELKPAFGLAGLSIGSLLVGSSLQSKLPVGVTNPVTQIGVTGSKFVAPLGTIGFLSIISKQLKKIKGGKI